MVVIYENSRSIPRIMGDGPFLYEPGMRLIPVTFPNSIRYVFSPIMEKFDT